MGWIFEKYCRARIEHWDSGGSSGWERIGRSLNNKIGELFVSAVSEVSEYGTSSLSAVSSKSFRSPPTSWLRLIQNVWPRTLEPVSCCLTIAKPWSSRWSPWAIKSPSAGTGAGVCMGDSAAASMGWSQLIPLEADAPISLTSFSKWRIRS